MKAACASGGRVRDIRKDDAGDPPRHLCPLVEHAPHTLEGHLVLDLVRRGQALKSGFFGVEGVDYPAALDLMRLQIPDLPQWLGLELLEAAEEGLMAGIEARRGRKVKPEAEQGAR